MKDIIIENLERLCREYGREMPSSRDIIELRDNAGFLEGWAVEDDCGELLCWDGYDFFTPAEPEKILEFLNKKEEVR
ncbi:MAG: hypothetical protein ACP6IQ_02045 [Candidatus Njordarchaeia archaeon]